MTSEIRTNSIKSRTGLSTVSYADTGIIVSGIVTATSFSGDGSNLTGISAGVSLSNGVDNRVVTATGAAGLNGEANLTFDGTNLDLPDNKRIRLGDGNDLVIESDGTNGLIKNHVGGAIFIRANENIHLSTNASDGGADSAITCVNNGGVELHYDNDKVFQTSTSQVQVKRRVQIYTDAVASGHQMSIGQWDGSNHRIEGDSNRPVLITSYNSGGVQMGVSGANKVAVNSHGLTFNGDTSSGNALDDYEEGVFAITAGSGSNAIFHSSNNQGSYTKIGRQVTIAGQCRLSGGSGNVRIALPFNSAPNGADEDMSFAASVIGYDYNAQTTSDCDGLFLIIDANVSYGRFMEHRDNNPWTSLDVDTGGYLRFTITYFTT